MTAEEADDWYSEYGSLTPAQVWAELHGDFEPHEPDPCRHPRRAIGHTFDYATGYSFHCECGADMGRSVLAIMDRPTY